MTNSKPLSHQTNIVRLGEPRKHPNADSLELFDVGGYQCVTKIGTFKAGDLAVYIQPDSVVPQTEPFRFIWGPYAETEKGIVSGEPFTPAVGENRRRITCKRLRKEYSEGLLMPLSDFPDNFVVQTANEGEDVSDELGITHYEGDKEGESTEGNTVGKPKRKYPHSIRGWVYFVLYRLGFKGARKNLYEELAFPAPEYDVANFKNYKNVIKDGEIVFVTEKIHGSQGRYVFRDGRMFAGSSGKWRAEDSPCVWRKALKQNPWIEEWCRANEGAILYGEVVPTQKGYTYGCQSGEVKFYVFDIRNATGEYMPKQDVLCNTLPVPLLYRGPFNREVIAKLVDGVSAIDGKTQREGVVVTVADPARWERGLGRVHLKWKSNAFLEKEGNR